MKDYALYKGEELIRFGTIKELAKFLGVKEKTILYYGSPANKRKDKGDRYVIEKIELKADDFKAIKRSANESYS